MNNINNTDSVKKQYANAGSLSARMSIHDKYSTNKLGFRNWIFANYKIEEGMRVLELGCGTGDIWKGRQDTINRASELILSDFSEGMLASAKAALSGCENIKYELIDIQAIPYEDEAFDIVIANMMLYHVPDMDKALSEVYRVLKQGGKFYSATYGEHGIMEYLAKIFAPYGVRDDSSKSFTLQNGEQILKRYFSSVEKLLYIDSLAVTNIDDMVEYIASMSSMAAIGGMPKSRVKEILCENMTGGVLNVPKEYGMFVSAK